MIHAITFTESAMSCMLGARMMSKMQSHSQTGLLSSTGNRHKSRISSSTIVLL